MAIRFRKSVKLLPGVRLNASKSGFSWTLGGRGASVSIGKRGTFLNTSLPGTGLSSRQRLGGGPSRAPRQAQYPGTRSRGLAALLALFTGGVGGQYFYLRRIGTGLLCLVLCWTLLPALIGFFQALKFGLMSKETFEDQYS